MYLFLINLCLVVLHMGSRSVQAAATPIDGEVLFDSSDQNIYEMPASCKGKSFCFDKGNEYPDEKIAELLENMPFPLDSGMTTSFSFRNGDEATGNTDCPADTAFVDKPIYYILDKKDVVRVVVQSPKKFQQIYSAKWCQYPGQINRDTPHFLKGSKILQKFRVECVDTYLDTEFLVLSDEDFGLSLELASPKGGIPVYCRCRYSERGED